jgi:hypothetical protein
MLANPSLLGFSALCIKPFHEEILAIATVIITIYTVVLARVARRQTKDTRILQRAYLGVLPGGIHILNDRMTGVLNDRMTGVAHIEIHNGGNLPATRTKWFIDHSLETHGDWDVGKIDVRLARTCGNTVSPKATMRQGGPAIFLKVQGIDTTTPSGKAMFQMLGVFGEFERSMIQERVRAGLKRAKDEGKQLGRPRIAPELEKRILAALNKPRRTEGVRKIAARFGVDPSTVQRISRPFDEVSAAVA